MLDHLAPAAFLLAFVGLCLWTYYHFHRQRRGPLWVFFLVLPYIILSVGIADYCLTSQLFSAVVYGVVSAVLIATLQYMTWQESRWPAFSNGDSDESEQ
jgi:ABC-type uncharacterized transport system YnjBCD permease subunit